MQPGPCTCLTKNYTPEGMVVFQDLCTKEMASAPVDGVNDQASAVQGPASYAGQTYRGLSEGPPGSEAARHQEELIPHCTNIDRPPREKLARAAFVLPHLLLKSSAII